MGRGHQAGERKVQGMNTSRPTTLVIAIVLLVLYSLASFLPFPVPEGEEGPPAVVIYGGYVLGILGLVAAFGLWQGKRWGLILALVVVVLGMLSAAPGIVFAPTAGLQIAATAGVVGGVIILVLLLLPSSRRSVA